MNVENQKPQIITPTGKKGEIKESSSPLSISVPVDGEKPKPITKNKKTRKQKSCGHKECKKKLSLTALKCRCGLKFCMRHFHSDKHDCSFDYTARAKKHLEEHGGLGGGEIDKIKDRI